MSKHLIIIIGALAAGMLAVYYALDPASSTLFPKCPFLLLTGLRCPGCGSQRAVHCLLHGDVAGAAAQNLLLVVSIPLLLLLFAAEAVRRKCPRFYRAIYHPRLAWTFLALTLLWWTGRNLFGW